MLLVSPSQLTSRILDHKYCVLVCDFTKHIYHDSVVRVKEILEFTGYTPPSSYERGESWKRCPGPGRVVYDHLTTVHTESVMAALRLAVRIRVRVIMVGLRLAVVAVSRVLSPRLSCQIIDVRVSSKWRGWRGRWRGR